MRILTLGLDAQGRSCLLEEKEVTTLPVVAGVKVANLFSTSESPPVLPPPGQGVFGDLKVAPGLVQWSVVDLLSPEEAGPTQTTTMHYNNGIELFCVLEGSMQIGLGDGTTLELLPGDCVAMPGVDHASKGGPHGARVLNICIGLAPAEVAPG